MWRQKASKLLILPSHSLQIPWLSHQPEASSLQICPWFTEKSSLPYISFTWVHFEKSKEEGSMKIQRLKLCEWCSVFFFFIQFFFPFSIWAFASKHWLLRTRIFKENPHTWSPSSAFKLSTYQESKETLTGARVWHARHDISESLLPLACFFSH